MRYGQVEIKFKDERADVTIKNVMQVQYQIYPQQKNPIPALVVWQFGRGEGEKFIIGELAWVDVDFPLPPEEGGAAIHDAYEWGMSDGTGIERGADAPELHGCPCPKCVTVGAKEHEDTKEPKDTVAQEDTKDTPPPSIPIPRVECSQDPATCGGAGAHQWCIIGGNVCAHLRLGQPRGDAAVNVPAKDEVLEVGCRVVGGAHPGQIIATVDPCPFCKGRHSHSMVMGDERVPRIANCGRGEYIIRVR